MILGTKARSLERAGPFEAQRRRAEVRFERAVGRSFRRAFRFLKRRLRQETGQKAVSDLPDEEFWGFFEADLLAELGSIPEELLREGFGQASALGLAVDFDLVNAQVLELVETYTNEWWGQLSRITRERMRGSISTWIESGKPLSDLIKDLESLFGPARAKMIATTETTRLFTEGHRMAYASAGVTEVVFVTAMDDLVDPDCASLEGQRFDINMPDIVPPIHVNCRCDLLPVAPDTEAILTELGV